MTLMKCLYFTLHILSQFHCHCEVFVPKALFKLPTLKRTKLLIPHGAQTRNENNNKNISSASYFNIISRVLPGPHSPLIQLVMPASELSRLAAEFKYPWQLEGWIRKLTGCKD